MTVTYHFDSVEEIDQKILDSLKAAFKGRKLKLKVESKSNNEITPKIEAAIQNVENGGQLMEFDSLNDLKKAIYEKID